MAVKDPVYTLSMWHVKPEREREFVAAWKELDAIVATLPRGPSGLGMLIQSTTEPTLFYSFGPWRSSSEVAAMRSDPRAQEGIQKLRELCSEATPGMFRVVAESQ